MTELNNGDTISTREGVVRVSIRPKEDITGIIVQPGVEQDKILFIINESPKYSLTFAEPEISNVADKQVIGRLSAVQFVWDTQSKQWWVNWPREQQ